MTTHIHKLATILFVALPLTSFTQGTTRPDLIILDSYAVENLRIQLEEVEERAFESTVFAVGRVEEIPSNRSVVSSRIAGRITDLHVFEGDSVETGQVLATVESRLLGDPPPSIDLSATQPGLVISSHIQLGQPVEPTLELMDISDRSKMWAIAKIPEQEASQVKLGTLAHINIPALGEAVIDAKLVRFGVDADRQAGTIDGIFELDNSEDRLLPGMRAEFSIVLSTRPDILSVPKHAIQGDPTKRVVFVQDFELPNAFIRTPLILGEQNDQYAEVIEGLFPGDLVVTRGSYSLGFAAEGSGMSLKEALDAAHGHEHNEDGSEITPEQRRAEALAKTAAAGELEPEARKSSKALQIYSAVITLLLLVVAQQLWRVSKLSKE